MEHINLIRVFWCRPPCMAFLIAAEHLATWTTHAGLFSECLTSDICTVTPNMSLDRELVVYETFFRWK